MKVYFINSVLDFGSTGKIVRDLANELKSNGHEIRIAYGRNKIEDEPDAFFIGNTFENAWHLLLSRLLGQHGLHSKRATQKLINDIKSYSPDVVHLHNIHGYYLNVPMLMTFLKKQKVKVLWTLHDAWAISGSSAYFDYSGCKIWDDGCVVCNSTKDYPKASFYINQKKNFKWKKEVFSGFSDLTIITPSFWLQKLIEQSFLSSYSIKTIHNGIDTSVFTYDKSRPSKQRNKPYRILGVASYWEKRKGLDDFIALSSRLGNDYEIILIGLTHRQINDIKHINNITALTRTNNINELVEYYQSSNVFVNPTYEDNYPTTNLEALCCGTPVVAYATGGNAEVADKPYMTIVDKNDISALTAEIMNVINSAIDFSTFDTSVYDKSRFSSEMYVLYK